MRNVETTLRDRLASVVNAMDYEFVGCEMLRQGRGSVLRIFIDKPQGITVEDCSRVSRQLSAMLDVEDPIQGDYTLEISSPGLNRPLFDVAHYQNQIGQKIKVRLYAPIANRRNFVGMLVKVDEDKIHLMIDESGTVELSFSEIERANVIADI
jgi:ribosome maturation factor RimP